MTLKEAFKKAEALESKLTPEYINNLTGLSSPKVWHLLNILCEQAETYLEVGTYMGSTLLAARYGNNTKAYAVDNFCMKPHTSDHFYHNVRELQRFKFIEKDCFDIQNEIQEKIDLYFYDGEHSYDSQYKAIAHFVSFMTDEFIYVCDDWNNQAVRDGTLQAIADKKLEIVEFEERRHSTMKDKDQWWCGIGTFKLRKPHDEN